MPSRTLACPLCSEVIPTSVLKNHVLTHFCAGHTHFCHTCDLHLPTKETACEHLQYAHNLSYFACTDCDVVCFSLSRLKRHQLVHNPTVHRCEECGRSFFENKDLVAHRESLVHQISQFHCCDCDLDFPTKTRFRAHLSGKVHARTLAKAADDANPDRKHCIHCRKEFTSAHARTQHENSIVHNPISKDLKCFGGAMIGVGGGGNQKRRCKKEFNCPSAMIHHLESGSCSSGIDRKKIDELVVKHDEARIITSSSEAVQAYMQNSRSDEDDDDSVGFGSEVSGVLEEHIHDHGYDSSSSDSSYIFTPSTISSYISPHMRTQPASQSSSSGLYTPSDTSSDITIPRARANRYQLQSLTTPSFSSSSYASSTSSDQTLLTPTDGTITPRTPTFRNATSERPKLYHCPLITLDRTTTGELKYAGGVGTLKKMKNFTTLSGMTQHLESGACAGGKETFNLAVDVVMERLKGLGLGEVKLIG